MLGYEVDPEDEALFDNAYIERIPTERSSKSALANPNREPRQNRTREYRKMERSIFKLVTFHHPFRLNGVKAFSRLAPMKLRSNF